MTIFVKIVLFHTAFLTFLTSAYRLILWSHYDRYKQSEIECGKRYNWLYFVFNHQLNSRFNVLYGKPSRTKLFLIPILTLLPLAMFAQHVL